MGNSLFKDISIVFFLDMISFSRDMNRIVEEMSYLVMLKNTSNKFLSPDPGANDVQNLIILPRPQIHL